MGLEIPVTKISEWVFENCYRADYHYVVLFTYCRYEPSFGEPRNTEPHKHTDPIWVPWDEMPDPIMAGIVRLKHKGLVPPPMLEFPL